MDREKKRRLTQAVAAVLYNAHLPGFATGRLYRGPLKRVCAPGLNCYSCPGAVASCPLGSLQNALAGGRGFPLYVLGLMLLFGALLGRLVCAFLCPFGLLQELLYRLPGRKIGKSRWTRRLTYIKYPLFVIFVILIPLYVGAPGFCKWICPAGTLEAGVLHPLYTPALRELLGATYWWKISLAVTTVGLCAFCFRAFCRFVCPLGAFYGLFNRISPVGVRVDEDKCVRCGACVRHCKMDVRKINDTECIRCGGCAGVCPTGAIDPRIFHRAEKAAHPQTEKGN